MGHLMQSEFSASCLNADTDCFSGSRMEPDLVCISNKLPGDVNSMAFKVLSKPETLDSKK